MLSIEDIKKIAKLKGIRNLGNAEKDYLLDIALLSISRNTKDELVFKGGTCMSKFYRLDRFSEDLDFSVKKEIDISALIKKIISDIKAFGIDAEIKSEKKPFNSVLTTIRTKGPIYNGNPNTLSNIRIDVNLKSEVILPPAVISYNSLYPDIPTFSIPVMQEKEIAAEKVRAIFTREKARDVYDLWFLLKKGIELDLEIVKEKLEYYNLKWSLKEFISKLRFKESVWESELSPLITSVPNFREVKKFIIESIERKK